MGTDKVVTDGYIKLLALSVSHLMTEIIMEKNTNCQEDIDAFREKYGNIKSIIIFIIHMGSCDDIVYDDYKKICKNIHCFDSLRDIVTNKGGAVLERNDVINDRLWDTSRIKYLSKMKQVMIKMHSVIEGLFYLDREIAPYLYDATLLPC